jgi:formylglycine-generating enzyme required for sulfatase activity
MKMYLLFFSSLFVFYFSPVSTLAQSSSLPPEILKEILSQMVFIEGSAFQMGCTPEQGSECSNDEFPVHRVEVESFYLLSHEFIQAWWLAVDGDNPSSFCRGGTFPVETVSHTEVLEFIGKLNKLSGLKFRLPTEAEWEFAARGGKDSCAFKFSGSNDPNDISWNSKNSFGKTRVVKLKRPNNLGLYDMSGNVWEWVSDPYKLYRIVANGQNAYPDHYVIRGGSYAGSPSFCRNSIRYHYEASYKNTFIGFRLALDKDQMPKP